MMRWEFRWAHLWWVSRLAEMMAARKAVETVLMMDCQMVAVKAAELVFQMDEVMVDQMVESLVSD